MEKVINKIVSWLFRPLTDHSQYFLVSFNQSQIFLIIFNQSLILDLVILYI